MEPMGFKESVTTFGNSVSDAAQTAFNWSIKATKDVWEFTSPYIIKATQVGLEAIKNVAHFFVKEKLGQGLALFGFAACCFTLSKHEIISENTQKKNLGRMALIAASYALVGFGSVLVYQGI